MPIQTQGIVVHSAGDPWKIEEITLSDLADDEILVEMVAGGVCHTDIKTGHGKFSITPPIVLGHEGVGRVKDVNKSSNRFKEGDAVILSYASCSKCDLCQSGYPSNCELLSNYNFYGRRRDTASQKSDDMKDSYVTLTKDNSHLNGNFFGQSSFSKFAIVNISCAVKVDVKDNEELQKLVLGCAFQTGAGAILNVCQPKVHSTLAIWGCGGVGLSAIMAAKLTSPSALIAIDISPSKLELATKYGATHTIDPSNLSPDEVRERILKITTGKGVNFALDCVGNPGILSLGHRCLTGRGMLVTVGGTSQPVSFVPSQALQKGLVYRGCHQGDSIPAVFIPKLMDLWRKGSFPFDDVLSFYRFEDFESALRDLESGKAIKPVLVF